jgi:hypothetical protein
MTRAEKRQHVWRLLKENATRSNREIARIAGVSHVAVGTMRKEFEADCETYHPMETYHPAAGKIVDLANDPIEDIAAKVPKARRAALVKALLAASSQAKRPGEWKYRTSPECGPQLSRRTSLVWASSRSARNTASNARPHAPSSGWEGDRASLAVPRNTYVSERRWWTKWWTRSETALRRSSKLLVSLLSCGGSHRVVL